MVRVCSLHVLFGRVLSGGVLFRREVRAPAIGHLGQRQASIHHQPCRLGAFQELRLRHFDGFKARAGLD